MVDLARKLCEVDGPMPIQWYPGHMTKARRELAAVLPTQDFVIEVLDARMPSASANPVIAELRGDKPRVVVLTKSDLAEEALTAQWLRALERRGSRTKAIASTTDAPGALRKRLPEACRELGLHAPSTLKPLRALIAGVPNVGKSTLINTLLQKSVAKVSDKPAVTKSQQQVVLKSGLILCDSPGITWPKIDDEAASYRLALLGSIPDTAIDLVSVALFGAEFLLQHAPSAVVMRMKLSAVPTTPTSLLEEVGRRRGCLKSGGIVDLHKAADILIHEVRAGRFGRLTLEHPTESLTDEDRST